jgi:transcriptional regulator with XRE-family HTH domain
MQERKLNIDSIRLSMENKGLNQTELAKKMNVSKESVSQWLKGEKIPRPAKLLQLSKSLGLSFNDLVLKDNSSIPIIAYRTNKKKKLTEEQEFRARDMGETLKVLLPYLNSDSVFTAPFISDPIIDDDYIQKVSSEIRRNCGIDSKEIKFSEIMKLYSDFRIILIPVMWGKNGDNGLYINLPKNQITFVYANLDKVITDFNFWLLHELAHTMTPSLHGDDSETFADSFAAAVLFPRTLAKETYEELSKIRQPGTVINRIKELASKYVISPYTILGEMKKYAKSSLSPVIEIHMGGAVTNFNKQVGLVSEIIFGEENPDAAKYIDICLDNFETDFFCALSRFIRENNKEAGIVQRVMNIPIADAKGVHRALAEKTDFT